MPLIQDSSSGGVLPPLNLPDFAASGTIGTASSTVDTNINQITLNQVTASVVLDVPAVTTTTDYKIIDFQNIGAVDVTLNFFGGSTVKTTQKGTVRAAWNGATWAIVNNTQVTPESGAVIFSSANISVPAANTTPANSILVATINIPTAGTWEIQTCLNANLVAFLSNGSAGAFQGLFRATAPTALLAGTQRSIIRIQSGNPGTAIANATQIQHSMEVTTTAATLFQVRAWSPNALAYVIEGAAASATIGDPFVKWRKISGQTAVTGQIVDSFYGQITTFDLPTTNAIAGVTGVGNLATSGVTNTVFTLPANKTFRLEANINVAFTTGTNQANVQWQVVSGGAFSSNSAAFLQNGGQTGNSQNSSNSAVATIITTTVTTVRLINTTGAPAMSLNGLSGVAITQIGSTAAGALTIDTSGSGLATTSGNNLVLPTSSYYLSNDNTAANVNLANGAGAKTLTVGSTTTTSSTLIQSGTGGISIQPSTTATINIATGVTSGAINIGTGASAKNITVGSTTGSSNLSFFSGTGGVQVQSNGAGVINIGTNASTGAINIGTGGAAKPINIGNTNNGTPVIINGHGGVTLAEAGTASAVNIRANNFRVNIQDTSGSTVIGNAVGASAIELLSGTGGVKLETTGAGLIGIGTNTSTGAINFGTGAQAFINIGTGTTAKAITISNAVGASGVNIQTGTGGVNIRSTGAGSLNIGDGASTGTVSIGTSGNKNIDVGHLGNTGTLALRGGTAGMFIDTPSGAPIGIGITGTTGTISIGTSGARAITIGSGTATALNLSTNGALSLASNGATTIAANGASNINLNTGTGKIILGGPTQAFDCASGQIRICSLAPDGDNFRNLGNSGARWNSVWSANGAIQTSDRTMKKEITPLTVDQAWSVLDQIKTYNFRFKDGDQKLKSGVMAQEVLEFAPDKVWGDKDGEYGVNYNDFVAELICTVQDLQRRIKQLEG